MQPSEPVLISDQILADRTGNPEPSILSQKPDLSLTGLPQRKLRVRWLLALSSLPFFGVYAAFGIAPQTVTDNIPISSIVEEVALPAAIVSLEEMKDQTFWQTDVVRRDDTLGSLLKRLNILGDSSIAFLRGPDGSPLSSQLRPGQPIQAQTNANGDLLKLSYQVNSTSAFNVEMTDSGFTANTIAAKLDSVTVVKSAEIKSSLFGATDSAEIPDQIAIQMAEIFSSDIDFHTDLRRGDRFVVVYETNYNNGAQVSTGKVLAAEFINDGKTYRAVMYRNPQGEESYYTPEGKSLHKSFLRSPLEFSRISSGFSLGRFHPILQHIRAHKGVDYAAPIGTRVKAPADAIVDFAGVKNGYGNVIVLRHQNGINTIYGHLSRFAAGLRKGMHVAQSDIIGYVGMTGLATGPHLHYEFLVNGQHLDPLKVALPKAMPLAPQYQADFKSHSSGLFAQLNLLSASKLASLESE